MAVEAQVEDASDYTFEIVGQGANSVAVDFSTLGATDASVTYQVSLVRADDGETLGTPDWIGSGATGSLDWTLDAPGIYSLVISQIATVSAYDAAAANLSGIEAGGFSGEFDMRIVPVLDPEAPVAAPEPSTWLLMATGLYALAWMRGLRRDARRKDLSRRAAAPAGFEANAAPDSAP